MRPGIDSGPHADRGESPKSLRNIPGFGVVEEDLPLCRVFITAVSSACSITIHQPSSNTLARRPGQPRFTRTSAGRLWSLCVWAFQGNILAVPSASSFDGRSCRSAAVANLYC
jgi:hypothetical protein